MLTIDLTDNILFEEDMIEFEKTHSFVFGKNGIGKSTLTNLIVTQNTDCDVRVFQGFEKVIGDNNKLNAIVLGEENIEINKQIQEKNKEIEKKKQERQEILLKIEEPEKGENNLWTKKNNALQTYNKKNKEIENFCKQSAVKIKNMQNPQISTPNYNMKNFSEEIKLANFLQETEIKIYEEILKSDVKTANYIIFPQIDLFILLNDINDILQRKVKEKVRITRIENDNVKSDFARRGMEIHQRGDVCAFCGSIIEDDTFTELERYFLADDVLEFQALIGEKIGYISQLKNELNSIIINEKEFYSEYEEKVKIIKQDTNVIIREQELFYQNIIDKLILKQSNLFSECDVIACEIPQNFELIRENYNELVEQNNTSDLATKQKFAKNKLRYHYIQMILNEYEYKVQDSERKHLYKLHEKIQDEVDVEREKITGDGGIDVQIRELQNEIVDLQNETKSEKKLAENINKKLKNMVSFELVHCDREKEQGFYAVKCLRTGKQRDITELSTGEKNIIAFLYFIEKLEELPEENQEKKDRIIIFDDPMNSNDDSMQYLIIDELQSLIKSIKAPDRFILLTHNNHFYLNVEFKRKYKENTYIHLLADGKVTHIEYIKKLEDDFKTSYEGLWEELKFLYKSDGAKAEMMLNPIRRIVETYTKFNVVDKYKFCGNQKGAMKLFNVNSHSIDDLEAELNGKSKKEIMILLQSCFKDNGVEEHFKNYWKETDDFI